jgi:hypothetical protein
MSLANLPGPIATFIEAARAGSIRDLVATMSADAAVLDRGREHRGPAIVHWGNWYFVQHRKLIDPIKASVKESHAVLSVAVSDIGRTKSERLEWIFTMDGQKISALSIQVSK